MRARGQKHSVNSIQRTTRYEKVNKYLWNMHKIGKYTEGYNFYLQYLEKSEKISFLDTVAQVYNDNGNKKKAIEIYEQRIIPWLVLESEKIKNKYMGNYKKIKMDK